MNYKLLDDCNLLRSEYRSVKAKDLPTELERMRKSVISKAMSLIVFHINYGIGVNRHDIVVSGADIENPKDSELFLKVVKSFIPEKVLANPDTTFMLELASYGI